MNRRSKIVVSLILSGMLTGSTVYANPSKTELENSISDEKNNLEQTERKQEELETKLQTIDNEISTLMVEIQKNEEKITQKEEEITKLQEELDAAKQRLEETRKEYNERMVVLYKQNGNEYLNILFSSKSLSDFINNIDFAKRLSGYTNDIIAKMEKEQKTIENNEKKLKEEKDSLENTRLTLEDDKEKSLKKQEESNKLLLEVQAEAASLSDSIKSKERQLEEEVKKQLEEEQKKAEEAERQRQEEAAKQQNNNSGNNTSNGNSNSTNSSNNGSSEVGSATGQKIVSKAMEYLGVKYVWGGTTPSGFDCSGLVQYVYKFYGITTGRTTYDQIKRGTAVDRSNLQIGDLVFFGTSSDPHHVGIYAGGGNYIHAPRTGDVVKVSALSGRSDYLTARRLL